MAVIIVLAARLWYLQVVQGSVYEALSIGNRVRVIPSLAPRGEILDRNNVALASNRLAFCVSIVPQDMSNKKETIAWLGEILDMTPETIEQKISAPRRPFEPIMVSGCFVGRGYDHRRETHRAPVTLKVPVKLCFDKFAAT